MLMNFDLGAIPDVSRVTKPKREIRLALKNVAAWVDGYVERWATLSVKQAELHQNNSAGRSG